MYHVMVLNTMASLSCGAWCKSRLDHCSSSVSILWLSYNYGVKCSVVQGGLILFSQRIGVMKKDFQKVKYERKELKDKEDNE